MSLEERGRNGGLEVKELGLALGVNLRTRGRSGLVK